MGKFFLGVASVLIVIGVAIGSLWLCDKIGIIKMDQLLLNQVGKLVGRKDLATVYELGKKRSDVLQEKESELSNKERLLAARETKLQRKFTELQDQKQLWLKEHSKTDQLEEAKGQATVKTGAKAGSPSDPLSDPVLKNYLATIGAMKAEKVAAVIQKLPDETVFLIFNQLRKNQAAKVMENLPPDYLTRLTRKRVGFSKQ